MSEKHRKFLQDEYERRSSRNSQYSMRAFAKDLDISKSSLHNVLAGKRGLAPKSLDKVFERLRISEKEKIELFALTDEEHHLLPEEDFSQIYHWWYFAILSLCNVLPAKACPKWISNNLGIELETAKKALNKLVEMQFIGVEEGQMVRLKKSMSTSNGVPSRSLKLFHSENLERAEKSIFGSEISDREISSVTFATDKGQFEKVKKEIKKFLLKSMKTAEKTKNQDRVCTMAVQFFPQTNINNIKENRK